MDSLSVIFLFPSALLPRRFRLGDTIALRRLARVGSIAAWPAARRWHLDTRPAARLLSRHDARRLVCIILLNHCFPLYFALPCLFFAVACKELCPAIDR
jgi:hypothetical protein